MATIETRNSYQDRLDGRAKREWESESERERELYDQATTIKSKNRADNALRDKSLLSERLARNNKRV